MSGEVPKISPVKLRMPDTAPRSEVEVGKPLTLSPETAQASIAITQDIEKGKPPSKEHIEELSKQVVRDVRSSGVPLDEKETERLSRDMKDQLKPQKAVKETVRLPSLVEYWSSLKHVEDTYGISKYKKELNIAGSTFVGLEVAQAAAQYMYFGLVDRLTGGKDDLEIMKEVLGSVTKVGGMDKDAKKSFLTGTLKKTSPIWAPFLLNISANQAEIFARKQFDGFIHKVSDSVNQRVTESLFLGEYAFLQDRSPAEVLDVIERGKMATIDLISTTYADLAPSLAAMGASAVPSWKINPIATALGVLRLPFLYKFSKKRIESVLGQREENFTQQGVLDTKIASLLSNLEIAKTTGKPDEVAKDLQRTMEEREKLFSGQRVGIAKKEGQEKLINILFDQVSPLFVAGMEVYRGAKEAMQPVDSRTLTSDAALFDNPPPAWSPPKESEKKNFNDKIFGLSLLNAYAKQWEFKYVQQANTQLAMHIGSLYANNILPDLQDIAEMEELLGPWRALDKPDGLRERARKPVSQLPNLDISVRNLDVKNILHDVSFDIKQGEFVAIRAQKGEGKTTLLRTMLGLYQPEKGSVSFGGVPVDGIKKYGEQSLNSQFGYANQNPGFIETMSLKDNLLLWNKDNISDEAVISMMNDLGMHKLVPRLNKKGKYYSGGELRLLGIARALLTKPKILFLDEPTANLDPASVDRIAGILKTICEKYPKTTIISVTHDEDFAKYADRTINLGVLNKKLTNEAAPSLKDNQVFEATAKAR